MESSSAGDPHGRDDRPLGGYAALLSVFALGASAVYMASRHKWRIPLRPSDLLLTGIASHELARIVTRDAVTGVVRAPFTEYVESAGAGEVKERARGRGLRRAVGQLLTCPYCAIPWAATALIGGLAIAPRPTRFVRSLLFVSTTAAFVQQLYAGTRKWSR